MRVEDFFLKQLESESCLWAIKRPGDTEVHGALVTYVDDLLLLGEERLAARWVEEIKRKWEVSEPEKVEAGKPTRFLGMELSRSHTGQWYAKQAAYTKDLLLRNLGQIKRNSPEKGSQWQEKRKRIRQPKKSKAEHQWR